MMDEMPNFTWGIAPVSVFGGIFQASHVEKLSAFGWKPSLAHCMSELKLQLLRRAYP